MNILVKLGAAMQSSLPFTEAWKRLSCIESGHDFKKSDLIEKLVSEKHPHTDPYFIYTVNIRTCRHCSLTYESTGLEFRK